MKKLLRLISLLFIFTILCSAQQSTKFSPEEIKQDLKYLINSLETAHYNLYANTSKDEYEKTMKLINESVKDSVNSIEAYRLMQPLLSKGKIGHCLIEYPFRTYFTYLRNGGTICPIDVCFYQDEIYVKNDFSAKAELEKGDKIISINNISTKSFFSKIYNFLSGEHEYSINSTIEALSFGRVYWFVFGECKTFIFEIEKPDGRIIKSRLSAISAGEFEDKLSKTKPLTRNDRELKFYDKVAYLFPGPFHNPSNNYYSGNTFNTDHYFSFLDSSFTEIRNRKTKNLIIDLRNNMGGMSRFSYPLISYIAKKPFKSASTVTYKTSEITKVGLKEIPDSILSGDDLNLKKALLEKHNGEFFDWSSEELHQPKDDSIKFHGNIFVLIDRYTYSEAIAISALMQDQSIATLIGEMTSNASTMYASTQQFELPNSKLKIMYPRAHIERRNKSASLDGVEPDINVIQNPFTAADEILDYTLNLINSK